ncbi:MAG: response regulator [Proteobacteria bacterium]|nr:response regulator [Pseudomonadota bacterium]HQR03824.1 response regulator [Rhodocyclaceae bacterium]
MSFDLDIGPLSWVKDEIDLALHRAAECIDRHTTMKAEGAALDEARACLHQVQGALTIVGIAGLPEFAAALEQLATALSERTVTWSDETARTMHDGLETLADYIEGLVAGRSSRPLDMLATYTRLRQAAGVGEVSAAELFFPDLSQRPPRREEEIVPLAGEALAARLRAARLGYERGMLRWLKDADGSRGATQMRNSVALIEQTQESPAARALWWIALAFFDGLIHHGFDSDATVRRLCAGLDRQIRKLLEGSPVVAETLLRELLYRVAVSRYRNEQIDVVRAAYRLADLWPVEEAAQQSPLPAFVPPAALPAVLEQAETAWLRFCSGAAAALLVFHTAIDDIAASCTDAPPAVARLTAALAGLAAYLRRDPLAHDDTLAHHVELGLALLRDVTGHPAQVDSDFASHVETLATCLEALMEGRSLPTDAILPLEATLERSRRRRAAEQALTSLAPIEQALDAFFRDAAKRPRPAELATFFETARTALEVLGEDRAVAMFDICTGQIRAFADPAYVPARAEFEGLARQLAVLGTFAEQSRFGHPDLEALQAPPAAPPSMEAELAQAQRMARTLILNLRDPDRDAPALRQDLQQHLEILRDDAPLIDDLLLEQRARNALAALAAAQPAQAVAAAFEHDMSSLPDPGQAPVSTPVEEPAARVTADDEDLLAIFRIEAEEILSRVDEGLAGLAADPVDRATLVAVRRGFHTLKGSSRMVGQQSCGEAAYAVESLLNRWLAGRLPVSVDLLRQLHLARDLFSGWMKALATGAHPPDTASLLAACAALMPAEAGKATETVTMPSPVATPETAEPEPVPDPTAVPAVTSTVSVVPPMSALTAAPDLPVLSVAAATEEAADADVPDPETLPVFLDEAAELATALAADFRAWHGATGDEAVPHRIRRRLHTLKGGARMAGLKAIGAAVHALEDRVDAARPPVLPYTVRNLEAAFDHCIAAIDAWRGREAPSTPASAAPDSNPPPPLATPDGESSSPPAPPPVMPVATDTEGTVAQLRIRADRVDEMVNTAGEIAIARTRIDSELKALKEVLSELTEGVTRLRGQLREVELQADTRISARHGAADMGIVEPGHETDFDPLEMDRYSRFQELTRMLAESVDDVATVQQSLLRHVGQTEIALGVQARLSRELSQKLMGVRMVAMATLSDRLQRLVRLTAGELGRSVQFDLVGGQIELDRTVLEKMQAPLEHLLRNAIAHGIEFPAARRAAGKDETGRVTLALNQNGNEVTLALSDDGAGLDLARIREEARRRGLAVDTADPGAVVFMPGFTTAREVSAVAGRGVGLDVVKSEVSALGGHIEMESAPGVGTTFRIRLPLTLGMSQAVLVKAGDRTYALPAVMVVQARELKPGEIELVRHSGTTLWLDQTYAWHYLPHLLGQTGAGPEVQRRTWLLLLKSGARRLALEVDALLGNQEVVMKAIGPQLARVPGMVGATVLGDGEIVLILNPVDLADRTLPASQPAPVTATVRGKPVVMVVDDSLTVRKVTGRLLERAGYAVVTACDGVDAMEQLLDLVPDVMLVDIEMPRMDGFDLARTVRADARLRHVPIVMITSRTADKHRDFASGIGVDHYLGKPYDGEALLALLKDYCNR